MAKPKTRASSNELGYHEKRYLVCESTIPHFKIFVGPHTLLLRSTTNGGNIIHCLRLLNLPGSSSPHGEQQLR